MKQRALSWVLTVCLVLGLCPVAQAAEGAAGELALTLHRAGAVAQTEFDLRLTAQDGQDTFSDKFAAPQGAAECKAHLSAIPDGRYTLTLTAPGYLPYTQELDMDGRCVQLTVYNYASVNDGRAEADGLFGVFPAGDVNGDGAIDDADADAITAAMGSADPALDLDGSGAVDLADLAVAVRNAGAARTAPVVHTVSSQVLADAVTPQTEDGTTLSSGTLTDLLDQQKDTVVALSPARDEPISPENPVALTLPTQFELTAPEGSEEAIAQAAAAPVRAEALYIAAPEGETGAIAAGTVTVEGVDADGSNVTIQAEIGARIAPVALYSAALPAAAAIRNGDAVVERDGSVVIDLGARVAIKKVTIRVTATADQGNLAQIAKVEFLSDFAERVPEPQLSIPAVLSVTNTESDGQGYKNLTVTWTAQPNVTGYELSVAGPGYNKTAAATVTTYTFQGDSFNGSVKSFETYQVKVRSVNGDWRSDWSEVYQHTVTCSTVPPRPQYLTLTPAVQSLQVSWDCKYDAQWFTLYYKAATDADYTAVNDLKDTRYTIPNLTGGVRYTVYVVAHNANGDSPKSQNAEAVPLTAAGVELPKYGLINVVDSAGKAMTHVTGIQGTGRDPGRLHFYGGEDWNVLADNDPGTYLEIGDWDNGTAYNGLGADRNDTFRGPEFKLDATYTFDTVRFAPFGGESVDQFDAMLGYYDGDNTLQRVDAVLYARADAQGRRYYEAIAQQPITADNFQLRTRTFNTAPITLAEVRLYEYDDLEAEVADLFADEMRTTLKDTVDKAQVDALVARVNTLDTASGEYHPHRETILSDLNYALELLADPARTAEVLTVDNQITAKDAPKNDFAQALSDYQPLGYVAGAGETVVLYVSDLDDATPRDKEVELNLVATQYHAQVAAWQKTVTRLKAGRNEVTIPTIGSDATERGGSLYLQYTGAVGAKHYAVRVSGAEAIPTLRLDGVTGSARTAAIQSYVAELEDYVAGLPTAHTAVHGDVGYAYDEQNCFLNATEITLENMMYSLPATQIWKGLAGAADPAAQLGQAIAAMEQEIDYFYAFKGLNRAAEDNDAYPNTRLNIRYHQMFTGAFMYAGGKHIGVEFGSAAEVTGLVPVETDSQGKYVSGKLTGWGIAHEIGHCINAGAYQRVEVTNNVFAQLSKTDGAPETSANFRTDYEKVYAAVATGTTGHTGDLAVQLAMYWQLHLAYDNDYAFRIYDTVQAQQDGLFYARLESYLRDPAKASPALPDGSVGDQRFMQAACAAAKRDVLDFFTAWGILPDETTRSYAANFEKETRKIQYIDDDSRLYRLEGGQGMAANAAVTAAIENAEDRRVDGNKVEIALGNNADPDAMLGYEIARNGKVVAFVTADQTHYTDIVTTANNQAFHYTVIGVDRLLNETEPVALPEVKVCHDGAIDKSGWSARTNMTSPKDVSVTPDDGDPERGPVTGNTTPGAQTVSAISAALDNNSNTVYCGKHVGDRPWIVLDLGGVEQVSGLRFTPAPEDYQGDAAQGVVNDPADLYKYRLFGYKVEISLDGECWETVKEGAAYTGTASNPGSWVMGDDVVLNSDGSYTLYFARKNEKGELEPFLYTYDAAYLRLTATDMSTLALAELDVLGPTGDNVELIEGGYGKLSQDYTAGQYADGSDCVIPAGSVVFYGAYKGDPAYNVVLLKDQNGKVLDGSQLIFAQVPEKGALGETSDGRWFYWLEDGDKVDDEGAQYNEMDQLAGLTAVRAELYRVQDAQALAGQRLTSTSLTMTLPAAPPALTIAPAQESGTAFTPAEETVQAVRLGLEADAAPTIGLPDPAGIYGDTGAAAETAEASPVALTGGQGQVSYTARPDSLSVAAQVDFALTPAPDKIALQSAAQTGLYQGTKYDAETGAAHVFAVARRGNLSGVTLTGTFAELKTGTAVAAEKLTETDGAYVAKETALTASAQASASGGGSTGGGTSGGSGGGVSGGSSGGSSGGGSGSGGGASGGSSGGSTQTPDRLPFTDVISGSWYEAAVRYVYTEKMMVGTSETRFSPELTTSRAMIVTILWRLEGSPASGGADYTDVPDGQWYTQAVRWAGEQGIVNGVGGGAFAPDAPISREQFAAILYRYAQFKGYKVETSGTLAAFADAASVSSYAVEAMTWANAAGLITGTSASVLSPQGSATRAQAATILYRFLTNSRAGA